MSRARPAPRGIRFGGQRMLLRQLATALCLAAMLGVCGSDTALGAEPRRGDLITVAGQVVDPSGAPIGGMTAVFEASRTRFSLRKLGQQEGATLRQPTTVDSEGRFRVQWQWDGHFNTFAIAVGFEVEVAGKPSFEILARKEIDDYMSQGGSQEGTGPILLTVQKAGYARWLASYLEGSASDAESKLFREQGRPDRISSDEREPGETAWWYFAAGKVYRFDRGELDRVIDFDPMPLPPTE